FAYDKNNLGKYKLDDTNTLQKFKGTGTSFTGMHSGGFIFWNQNPMGPMVYGWPGGSSKMLGFKFNGTKFDETPASTGAISSSTGWSSGCMVGSSNGGSNGIIWALTPESEINQHVKTG